MEALLTV